MAMIIERPAALTALELYVLIAEDEPFWEERIREVIRPIEKWPFYDNQFRLRFEHCPSVAAFKRSADRCLAGGAIVYATLDLAIPIEEDDDIPADDAGERMIAWCLDWQKRHSGEAHRLDICLISGRESLLARIEQSAQANQLKEAKRIRKDSLERDDIEQRRISDDIHDCVRQNLGVCIFREPRPDRTRSQPIWIGHRGPLLDLLHRADRIVSDDVAGIHLLFADAAGYEVDWTRLVTELHPGVTALDVFDVLRTQGKFDRWEDHFNNAEPHRALLVRNIGFAHDQRCDLTTMLGRWFFDRVRDEKLLVFLHFPFLETHMAVSKRLNEAIEQPTLDACLTEVYGSAPPYSQGIGFAYPPHERIVVFPRYQDLKELGVIRQTIRCQAAASAQMLGCPLVGIDQEVFEVLAEIDWSNEIDKTTGLDGLGVLRHVIERACRSYAGGNPLEEAISIEHFHGTVVHQVYHGETGFRRRGHFLYRLLERGETCTALGEINIQCADDEARHAIATLETLYLLYDGLNRLVELRNLLEYTSIGPEFTALEFEALQQAEKFMGSIFGSPKELRKRIDKLRGEAAKSTNWRHAFPRLETHTGRAAIENIRFSWPFTRLKLHPALDEYLRFNKINALILYDMDKFLASYSDLRKRWDETEHARREIIAELWQREEEQAAATAHARNSHARPILRHLDKREGTERTRLPISRLVDMFFHFESLVAICESSHLHRDLLTEHRALAQAILTRSDAVGERAEFVWSYIEALRRDGRLAKSIFRGWEGEMNAAELNDAIRLVAHVAEAVRKLWLQLGKSEPALLRDLASSERTTCTTEQALQLLREVGTLAGEVEEVDHLRRDLESLLRLFLRSIYEPHRVGTVDARGEEILLWRKEPDRRNEPAVLVSPQPLLRHRLVIAREGAGALAHAGYVALFPIDDLIRIRPGHGSLWGMASPECWHDLSRFPEHRDEKDTLDPRDQDWLPDPEQVVQSSLWRKVVHRER